MSNLTAEDRLLLASEIDTGVDVRLHRRLINCGAILFERDGSDPDVFLSSMSLALTARTVGDAHISL